MISDCELPFSLSLRMKEINCWSVIVDWADMGVPRAKSRASDKRIFFIFA